MPTCFVFLEHLFFQPESGMLEGLHQLPAYSRPGRSPDLRSERRRFYEHK
jgi:hypothetical protein